jgi:hypothetical protein
VPGLNATARNAMLDATASVWPPDTVSLHTADPGNTGTPNAGEVSGGSPAYARKAVTWAAASAGAKSSNAAVVFDVPGGNTVSHIGYWRGATFLGSRSLGTSESFTGQGTYTIASGSLTENLA